METAQSVSISKEDFLKRFLKLKNWLNDYWNFLEELPLNVFADDEQIIDTLRQQHQRLVETEAQQSILDMTGALLQFSLQHVKTEEISFEFSEKAPPPSLPIEVPQEETERRLQNLVRDIGNLIPFFPEDSRKQLTTLLNNIASFFKAIIRKDGDDVRVQLSQVHLMSATKDSYMMVGEVAKITREIYNSFQDLSLDLGTEQEIRQATDQVPDAVQKLYSVIDRLEEAANDNLNFLEELLEKSGESSQLAESVDGSFNQLREHFKAFSEAHPELAEEMAPMQKILYEELEGKTEGLLEAFRESESSFITIMANQGFQDLTGQTLKKIIDFLEHLEHRLLDIVKKFVAHPEEEKSGKEQLKKSAASEKGSALTDGRKDIGVEDEEITLHGPDQSENKTQSQDDVDALLAELGF